MIENVYTPNVGDWFKDAQGQSFEIVAVDEDEGSVEVQFYDGEIEEYDADSWRMLYLVPIAPPEDWTPVRSNGKRRSRLQRRSDAHG